MESCRRLPFTRSAKLMLITTPKPSMWTIGFLLIGRQDVLVTKLSSPI